MLEERPKLSAKLSRFPRLGLAHLPTPLEPMKRVTAPSRRAKAMVKREDATGVEFGGNQVIIGEVTMAPVLSFYQLPDEEEALLDYVESTGKITAVPFAIMRSRSAFRPLALRECLNRFNPDMVAFGFEQHSELITIGAYFDKQGEYFTVSLMASPLIAYTRSRWRAPQQLGMSNLAAYWSYPNENATAMLDHPGDFIKWAKKIFRKGREIAPGWPEHESLRVTPLVADAIREGVKLVS